MSVKYTILQGDSVHRIAQNVLGNSEYWLDIVEANKLDYPFITDNKDEIEVGKNVKTTGDEIDIPVKVSDGIIRYMDAEDEIFGTDILLVDKEYDGTYNRPGGFIADGHGDIGTVTGEQCLLQDLIHHLLTPKGSLVLHPKYGSDFLEFVGKKNVPDNINRAVIELEKTFLTDSRVTGVSDIEIGVFETGIHIHCWIDTIIGKLEWKHILT